MSLPTIIMENNFGEEFTWFVRGGTLPLANAAANSILSNLTGSAAPAIANTYAAVSAKLTPAMLMVGFSAGAGTLSAADTLIQAINKLAGNTQNLPVTANLLTGLAAGTNTPIIAGNSILVALANLQAQISAL